MKRCPLPVLYVTPSEPYRAILTLADGTCLYGVAASSRARTVHDVFEGCQGRSFAIPLDQHITPLTNATTALCRVLQRLIELDDDLADLLLSERDQPTNETECVRKVHYIFGQVQSVVASAIEVHACLTTIAADPHATAMKCHPLNAYADMMVHMAMGWSRQVLEQLGLPDAITDSYSVNFDPKPEEACDVFVPGWPTAEAQRWWDDRRSRIQLYKGTLAQLVHDAPQRVERIKAKFSAWQGRALN